MKYAIVMTMKYTAAWLSLSRAERNAFNERHVFPVFGKFSDTVKVRFFDAEAFHAKISDFALIETSDLKNYYFMMECLRDSPLFSQQYLEIGEVIVGIEGGYEAFEKEFAAGAVRER